MSRNQNLVGLVLVLVLSAGVIMAQQPSPSPTPEQQSDSSQQSVSPTTPVESGENAGGFTLISSIEFGYRGLSVDGDLNKYQSDLNYRAGPRLFDSSFLLRPKEGTKGGLFETFLVTSTGWGGDPNGNLRVSAEQSKWYRFDGTYRRFKYFRFLDNFANPNWVFNPPQFSVPPKLTTGEHGYDTSTSMGDFDLTLLPKNDRIRFNIGYSPERYSGPAFTNYHVGGNEFNLLGNLRSRANDFRFGADGRLGPVHFSFLQGFRRFRDDSTIDNGANPGINLNPSTAHLLDFNRDQPTRGSVDFTRLSVQTLVAKRLDISGRVIYSKAKSEFGFAENFSGLNWNPRVSGFPPTPPNSTPNRLNLGQYVLSGNTERPQWLGDLGLTWMATDKFRLSNTFKVDDFSIDGAAVFADFFSISRGTRTDTIGFSNLNANTHTDYRRIQNTIEGDYQFNKNYSVHLGYRYASRRIEQSLNGFDLGSNSPTPLTPTNDEETNHTHAILAGFKARPAPNWNIYFDAEKGTADNVFFRIGNYDYTNIRLKSRYKPTSHVGFNVSLITKDNANPSEIAGVSLEDFGVSVKSRIFTSTLDWNVTSRFSINTGYTYHWINSKAIVDYFFNSIEHPLGNSLYIVRNNFFFFETVAQIAPRATLFTAYRINKDNGQGNRVADPTAFPGTLIASYPMSYQSPEARLAIKLHQRLDWNIGYQYYNYNESPIVGPRPQNYHAHLPYTSLRLYFGRRE
jgi:hypothetical protein